MTEQTAGAQLSGTAVAVLAAAAGGAIANDYVLQPALAQIAMDFRAPLSLITIVASAAMAGYLIGLALLVPLADRISPRALIGTQLLALSAALALAAAAPNPSVLIGCFVLVGALTTVAAQSSAVVGKHSHPTRRGARMGVVSAGISAGILLSRFAGGLLTDWIGWRGALLTFSALVAASAVAVIPLLPTAPPHRHASYLASLRTLPALLRTFPKLRRATAAGMLWFFAFNLIWVGLALHLAQPPFGLSAAMIGLYSLAGILGLIVTRLAGRLTDRFGNRAVVITGLAVAAVSALALTFTLGSPVFTAAALAFFDAGCFAAQVANQAGIVAIDPSRSGTLNATYLTLYYAAGAIGTATAGSVVTALGWPALTLFAMAAAAIAACLAVPRARIR
ncbi:MULTISPECIES: MFS transporter [Kitasatospora]|uniref:MFS transporter n=1 Tax=Kitasatospora aureofaciens TaxID=1894 RepID=UPI00052617F7|nr:MFS transporter [Kitasatospora aureofaciens]